MPTKAGSLSLRVLLILHDTRVHIVDVLSPQRRRLPYVISFFRDTAIPVKVARRYPDDAARLRRDEYHPTRP